MLRKKPPERRILAEKRLGRPIPQEKYRLCLQLAIFWRAHPGFNDTCVILGQAVGTAAAVAVNNKLSPREVGQQKIKELQELLMYDDCYLPWSTRTVSKLTASAKLITTFGNAEDIRNGIDRPIGDKLNAWQCKCNDSVEFDFGKDVYVNEIRLVLTVISTVTPKIWSHITLLNK